MSFYDSPATTSATAGINYKEVLVNTIGTTDVFTTTDTNAY